MSAQRTRRFGCPALACSECGQLYTYRELSPGETAVCSRCDAVIYRHRRDMVPLALALTVTGLVLFFLTNAFPFLGLRAQGTVIELRLLGASVALWHEGFPVVSALLLLSTIVFPLLELGALLVVFGTLQLDRPRRAAIFLYRWVREIRPWSMLEVFMLGALVAVVKLGDLALLLMGPSFWTFCFLVVTLAALRAVIDPPSVWMLLEKEPGQ